MKTLFYTQTETAPTEQPGELAGSYRILRKIAEGGMGELHEATHVRLPGRYAIKIMVPELAPRPMEAFARFKREAEVLSRLRHPNVVHILDFDVTADGRPFLAMEYLDGTLLRDELSWRGPLPLARALDIVGQVAGALAAMHDQGIVHRDLKPENLFLIPIAGSDRELVKVTDFGISKVEPVGDELRLTQGHAVFGTPHYMAPEQALGHTAKVDARADQFALAAIAYELVTGRLAFPGDSLGQILLQVIEGDPPAPADVCPGLSAGVSAAIMRALSKDPSARFPDIQSFQSALAEAAKQPAADQSPQIYEWACQEVPAELVPPATRWHSRVLLVVRELIERAASWVRPLRGAGDGNVTW
jgi:serine/threonine protein kinase